MEGEIRVYVGTYTNPILFGGGRVFKGKGEGIYLLNLDLKNGDLRLVETFKNIENPSFLVINKDNSYLYAVNELKEFQGKPSGSVSSFLISGINGDLTFVNRQPTNGTDPCHVELNLEGTNLYVSNFMSGSLSVFPVKLDGSIGETRQFIQYSGSGVHPTMQTGPHAHSLAFTRDGKYALVMNLGTDRVMVYKTYGGESPLSEAEIPFFETQTGAGPRHCTFSPNGKYCYVINELNSTILVLSYDKETGYFNEMQCVSTLPKGTSNSGNSCADIHTTPDGSFLFGSNRGHDSLIIYKIDKNTGLLDYLDCTSCGGKSPRNFAIEPTGNYLLCANLDSDDIVVFKIDQSSGKLTKLSKLRIPSPVCVIPFSL
jgi:6-phosphogluconolactonase